MLSSFQNNYLSLLRWSLSLEHRKFRWINIYWFRKCSIINKIKRNTFRDHGYVFLAEEDHNHGVDQSPSIHRYRVACLELFPLKLYSLRRRFSVKFSFTYTLTVRATNFTFRPSDLFRSARRQHHLRLGSRRIPAQASMSDRLTFRQRYDNRNHCILLLHQGVLVRVTVRHEISKKNSTVLFLKYTTNKTVAWNYHTRKRKTRCNCFPF